MARLIRIEEGVVRSLRVYVKQGVKHMAAASLWQRFIRWRASADQPWVALTFDDGPDPEWTAAVLDVLKQHAANRRRSSCRAIESRRGRTSPPASWRTVARVGPRLPITSETTFETRRLSAETAR